MCSNICVCHMLSVLGNPSSDRPGSQMSFLDQFLKESSNAAAAHHRAAAAAHHRASQDSLAASAQAAAAAARRGHSLESDDGDIEDNNRVGSVGSSRSNVSDLSPQDHYAQPLGSVAQNVTPRMHGTDT